MQPFLKWPGGKRWLISKYNMIFPKEYNTYLEPFLGGGSAFFHLAPKQAIVSDINRDLINTYQIMKKCPVELSNMLIKHQENHSVEYYYKIRNEISQDTIERAARFLYLNRTCFNGMYRVNHDGIFNVPIGTRSHFIEDIDLFEEYSQVLKNAHIRSQDFTETIRQAGDKDLIFADPPYAIANKQNSFIKYNDKLFSWKDQSRLLKALVKARDRGSLVICTNAFYPQLEEMYQENGFYTYSLNRFSSISGSSAGRGILEELLITSFPVQID